MALILHLTSTGPGRALIEVKGAEVPARDLDIAVQRSSDDAYIGNDGAWQIALTWHRLQPGSGAEANQFVAGPEIVDALVEAVRADGFCAQLRWDSGKAEGGLRIHGELFPSAARQPPPKPAPPDPGPDIEPKKKPGPIHPAPPEPPVAPGPKPDKRPRWPWIAAGLVGLLAALGLAAWQLGLQPVDQGPESTLADASETGEPDPSEAPGDGPEPAPEAPLEPEPEPDFGLEPEPEPDFGLEPEPELALDQEDYAGLSGRDYAAKLVGENPPGNVYWEHAKSRAKVIDCDAVLLLYDYSANADAKIAGEVARLYDPQGFVPSPCIAEPSPANAHEYYVLAAEGGVPHAQRRLGQILIEGRVSGPDYEDGIIWLEAASAAGDEDAQRILDELPTPGGSPLRTFENR